MEQCIILEKDKFSIKIWQHFVNIGESIDIVTNDGNALNKVTLYEYIHHHQDKNKYIFDRKYGQNYFLQMQISNHSNYGNTV